MLMATRDPSPSEGSSHIRYADELRQAFRWLNRFMVPLWRLGLGGLLNSWPSVGGQFMVLVHRGRRSGREYRTPLNYAIVREDIYCLAGFGRATDWYRNVLAAPTIQVWMRDGWWEAAAVDVSDTPERIGLIRAVLIGSGFATYVAGINPRRLSDVQLDEKTPGCGRGSSGCFCWPCAGAGHGRRGLPPIQALDSSHRAVRLYADGTRMCDSSHVTRSGRPSAAAGPAETPQPSTSL
jgi:deazaflavin-dependent oxidoreductase (nitroreductase family)